MKKLKKRNDSLLKPVVTKYLVEWVGEEGNGEKHVYYSFVKSSQFNVDNIMFMAGQDLRREKPGMFFELVGIYKQVWKDNSGSRSVDCIDDVFGDL